MISGSTGAQLTPTRRPARARVSTAFRRRSGRGARGSSNRAIVIDALANNSVLANNSGGIAVSPAAMSAVKAEVDALLTRVPQINPAALVSQATVAACTAALASAAVTLQ